MAEHVVHYVEKDDQKKAKTVSKRNKKWLQWAIKTVFKANWKNDDSYCYATTHTDTT